MADRKSTVTRGRAKAAKPGGTKQKKSDGFTEAERDAMKERARELKAEAGRGKSKDGRAEGERELLAKVSEMKGADQVMARRLHAIITECAPSLAPKTWYGMPAYARDGKVVCFFQSAQKFKSRYATFGFSDVARLDDGAMWPTTFALMKLGAEEETRIRALVAKAMG